MRSIGINYKESEEDTVEKPEDFHKHNLLHAEIGFRPLRDANEKALFSPCQIPRELSRRLAESETNREVVESSGEIVQRGTVRFKWITGRHRREAGAGLRNCDCWSREASARAMKFYPREVRNAKREHRAILISLSLNNREYRQLFTRTLAMNA